jgi:hypothetical protein
MKKANVFQGMKRYGIYLPALLLFLSGISIFLFPSAIRWILAGFFMASGLLLVIILHTLQVTARAMRERMSAMYVEKTQEEGPQALEAGQIFFSHIN